VVSVIARGPRGQGSGLNPLLHVIKWCNGLSSVVAARRLVSAKVSNTSGSGKYNFYGLQTTGSCRFYNKFQRGI